MRLENGLVRFDFDEETGSLRQITASATGKRYLNDPRGCRLAKLIVPTPEHNSRPLLSHEAGRPSMSRRGDALEIAFPELRDHGRKAGVFLSVRVRLSEGSPEALFSAEIRNESAHRVLEMWFPWIGGRSGKPGRTRDLVTTSRRTYADIYAQLSERGKGTHSFGHHHLRMGEDPIHQLPMMDWSEDGGGLSYIKYEQRPSPHILVFENVLYTRAEPCIAWTGPRGRSWSRARAGGAASSGSASTVETGTRQPIAFGSGWKDGGSPATRRTRCGRRSDCSTSTPTGTPGSTITSSPSCRPSRGMRGDTACGT